MLIEVKVPQLSESVSEATLVTWHKKEGDAVARDENLIDIETDKVVLETPAPADGVLVMGTGGITHNLQRVAMTRRFHARIDEAEAMPEIAQSAAFRGWMHERSRDRDWPALFSYRDRAPAARDMHPTDEHLLPFFVAAGAGGRDVPPVRLHESVTFGCLGMDAYAFGALAQALHGHASA